MFNLEFSLQELQELHVTLAEREFHLKAQIEHTNPDIAAIALRQLERVTPLLYYVGSVVHEHHVKDSARAEAEAKVEAFVERTMDNLDKKLMQGHLTQSDYEARVSILDNWAKSELSSVGA